MPATTKRTITQLKDMSAERVDGVTDPANGFPILMLKAVAEPAQPEAEATGCGCCEDCTAGVAKADADTERAKEPGVPEPVKDEAVKEAEEPGTEKPEAESAPPAATEKTSEPAEAGGKDETADLVKSLAEKVEGQEGVIKGLQAELKRLSDTPIPGTPFVMAPAAGNGKAEASKAAYFKDLAGKVSDPELASYYRSQAAALAGN